MSQNNLPPTDPLRAIFEARKAEGAEVDADMRKLRTAITDSQKRIAEIRRNGAEAIAKKWKGK